MAAKSNVIEMKQLRLETVEIPVIGTAPLIMHQWSSKAKKQMLDKQMRVASPGKEAKDPDADFQESIYRGRDGLPAFPSVAFKAAAVDAAIAMNLKKTNLRQSFHITGDMVAILGDEPQPREDMVRVGMGTADIRYRAEFPAWAAILNVTLNAGVMSIDQLVNLFDAAGFGIGIGEWRPQRDGQFGRFQVAKTDEDRARIDAWQRARSALARESA